MWSIGFVCTFKSVSRRSDAEGLSDVRLDVRVTSDERERMHAMAKRRKTTLSNLLRLLVVEEEKREAQRARQQERWGGR